MGILDIFKLNGKKAFVTGGARGIGKCIANTLAEVGADIAIIDINEELAEKTAEEIKSKFGVQTLSIKCDVTREQDIKMMKEAILDGFGTLDIAINNAGIVQNIPAENMSVEDFRKEIDVNTTGIFLTSQAAAQIMINQKKGGTMVNTCSMSAHIVNTPQTITAYHASKAAVLHLTRALAVQWVKYGIRVNCVSPGFIATEIAEFLEEMKPLFIPKIPLGRFGKVEDLAAAYLYLASDASRYTTGTDLLVDGGYCAI